MQKKCVLLLMLFIINCSVFSQDDIASSIIIMTDGTKIIGQITEQSSEKLVIQSAALGKVEVAMKDVKQIDRLNGKEAMSENQSYNTDMVSSTRYLVSPNGFLLKKGQSYYENIGVFFNSFAYGITDNFNIAAGGEIASLLFAERFPILYISPKVGVPFKEDKGAWSVGTTFFTSPSDDFTGFGFLNTSITLGNRDSNFSIGTGVGFNFEDGLSDLAIPIMVGGVTRLGPKLSLVSDNFIIIIDGSAETAILSVGMRFHFRNGGAFNAALWRPTDGLSDVIALPYVSATFPLFR